MANSVDMIDMPPSANAKRVAVYSFKDVLLMFLQTARYPYAICLLPATGLAGLHQGGVFSWSHAVFDLWLFLI